MPLAPHPYGQTTTVEQLPARAELLRRLSIRLEYASFKLSHSLTLHTLSELENLYIRSFHAQAVHRQQARTEREERTRKKWRAQAREADEAREGRRDKGECVDVIMAEAVQQMDGEFEGWSEKKLGKRRAVERDGQPRSGDKVPRKQVKRKRQLSAASAGEERPQFAPSTSSRLCLPQPAASSSRTTFAATHAEYAQQHDLRPYAPYDVPTLGKTTSELLSPHTGLSPSHSDSIPSLGGTNSSTSSFFAIALQQPHPLEHEHAASPFSARSTAASYGTTLAPASSSTSLHSATATTVSPLLEHAASPSSELAPPHPGPDHSSQPSPYPLPPPRSLAVPSSSSSQPHQPFTTASALLSTPHQPTPTPAASSSSKRSPILLGSQASFSALPPVPPLPFDGPPLPLGLSQGSQGWSRAGAVRGAGLGSSSPDQARRIGREKVHCEEEEERDAGGAAGSGSGFLPARLRAQELASGDGSDDELPPADSADLDQDDDGADGKGDGFDPLSQDTVVHESQSQGQSQSQSQQRDAEWSEEEAEGTRERWKVG
ncbi:hypothetical protein NBRC10512_006811 [Rhodotorula toruloides]|uniref:RHTO0S05e04060g1_1 n=2 Tax=Rhodotorula toruloides TaxID=5286 RepID=A0A061AYR4_RHOTO|nr:uncharacterized protein RHTO_07032 [Rhodotorula toruloides NP11]EMS23973.1 hypothetical protein RHTO_07032 [Rhodotorula toruloides NP11]CDR40484.1 RHTO0S05e04060g1_1 [Rhodotorula toruloides]